LITKERGNLDYELMLLAINPMNEDCVGFTAVCLTEDYFLQSLDLLLIAKCE